MITSRISVTASAPLLAFLILARAPARAEELTVDWMLDPENTRALQATRFLWLPDETLLLEEPSKPEAERHVERLDPRNLERKPAGDRAKLLASWTSLLGEEKAPKRIGMPAAAALDSKTLLYEREGDLFLADLDAGSVRRITNTEAGEVSPRFSPDGAWLAYVRDDDLYASETASGREHRLTRDGGPARLNGTLSWVYWEEISSRRDEGFCWSPDSRAILYLQSDDSGVSEFPLPDFEPAVPRVRRQRYPKAGGANPVVRAGIVEVASGETRWIGFEKVAKEPGAAEYIARVAWLPGSNGAAIETLNRAQNHLSLWVVDRASGEPRIALDESSPTWIDLHDDLHFLPDGDRFLWLSERTGHRHLYLGSARGGPALPLTAGEWELRSAGGADPWQGSVAWIDAGGGQVLLHAAQPSPIETQLYRVPLDGKAIVRVSDGPGSHKAIVSPGGRFFIDEYSRSGVPPRLTLHRIDGSLLSVIHPSSLEKLAAFQLAAPELFTVKTEDGTPLPARLFKPQPLEEGKKYPAIVYIYGGPAAPAVEDRWDGTWYLWAEILARRGFAVFTVDPRSASDQGRAKQESVYKKFYGDGELKDILAGVKHLKSLPFVDGDRVGIWGWSGGGTNTVYAMTRSEEFRAGIAVAGVADQRYYDTVYTERYMGKPSENEESYRVTAAAAGAAKLHGRLLLVHGTADDNVHPQNVQRFIHDLIAAGKQFELMLYPRRDHGIGDTVARKHLFHLMLDFWERTLKA